MPAQRPLEQAFWSKVDKRGSDECWPWTGTRTVTGYGRLARTENGHSRRLIASRLAWSLRHGKPFPEGLFALHTCDNPPCVNPAHIWPGTRSQNRVDALAKGRARGTSCPHPKTGPHIVPRVREGRTGWRCRLCEHWRNHNRRWSVNRLAKELLKLSPEQRRAVLLLIQETPSEQSA